MTSQLDLDQGGTYRQYVRRFLGPSIGWVWTPEDNFLNVSSGGTIVVLPGTTQVRVGITIPPTVTVQLPSAIISSNTLGNTIPGTSLALPILVVDTAGSANSLNITILPFGSETIDGLSSIKITSAYGSFTLIPRINSGGWTT